jgi:hypothetical protein
VLAAIDASRDAGGEPAGVAAASAIAQAARAAASAWHAGPQAAEERGALRKHTIEEERSRGALTRITADLAALNAFTAAAEAFVSLGYRNEDFVNSALRDYDKLVRLELGRYPEPGAPVDPSPGELLGPL